MHVETTSPRETTRKSTVRALRVVVADDQVAVRAGIKRAIEPHGLHVVAEASDADRAVEVSLSHRPDVCIMPG